MNDSTWKLTIINKNTKQNNPDIQNSIFKDECNILKQVNSIIQYNDSWTDGAKQKVDNAFNTAISCMLWVGHFIDKEQDDLK